MRPPSTPRQPPTLFFIASQAEKWMLGAHGRRAGRGRETDGVSAATWPEQGGSVTWLPKVCSALLPALLPLVIAFRCLEPNGHTGPQVTVMGYLTASDHCCGQGIPATGTWHQHRPAQALSAGFHTGIYPFPHQRDFTLRFWDTTAGCGQQPVRSDNCYIH